ncbi:alcohol dehydrogenase [Luteolibacter sp. LG18]|nr:alcohol dehydrogenase [Luteolibacter sp. LG18]
MAAVFRGHGLPLELMEFAVPRPGPGELLVEITCATICGSDVHTWHGRRNEPTPCVLGHEITGRVAGFGEGASRVDLRGVPLHVGDRVTWTLAASCGECFYCKRGLPQKCGSLFKYGHAAISPGREFSGGFAECCILTAGTGVLRLPEELPDAIAAPANCAVATVAAAYRRAEPAEGATVVVIGCGVLGLTACAMAAAAGAEQVIGCDLSAAREEAARAFGATGFSDPARLREVVLEATHGRGADLVLEFSGASQSVATAIEVMRTGATAVIAGTTMPDKPVALDPNDLVRRMLTLKGLHNYAPEDLVTAVDFLATAGMRYPYASLAGGSFALAQVNEAFASANASPGKRVAVIP